MVKLKVQKREKLGKQGAKKLRREGWIPAVVYGGKKENLHISVPSLEFQKFLAQKEETLELVLEDTVEKVKIQEIQVDTLKEEILHIDFLRLS